MADKPLTLRRMVTNATFISGMAVSCLYSGLCLLVLAEMYWTPVWYVWRKDREERRSV